MRILSTTKQVREGISTFDYIFIVTSVLLPATLGCLFTSGFFAVFGCMLIPIAIFMFAKYRDRRFDYAAISIATLGTVFLLLALAFGKSAIGYITMFWPILMFGSVLFVRYYFKFNLPVKIKTYLKAGWIALDALFALLLLIAMGQGFTQFAPIFATLLILIVGDCYGILITRETKTVTPQKPAKKPAAEEAAKEAAPAE